MFSCRFRLYSLSSKVNMTTPNEIRAQLVAAYRRRKEPMSKLARRFGLAWGTAKRIIEGIPTTGVRKCSAATQAKRRSCARLASTYTKKDGRVYPKYPTSASIAKKNGLSPAAVRRHLRSSGYKSFVRPKCVTRSPAIIHKRQAFAKAWRGRVADMRRIVFSDEHTVSTNDHSSTRMYAEIEKKVVLRRERSSRLQNCNNRMMILSHRLE